MRPMTREFVNKAEGDYDNACTLRHSRKRTRYDGFCFHCQQCVEKYLKARLQEADARLERTHDLVMLLQLLRSLEPLWIGMETRLKELNEFAVKVRYPGRYADPSE